MTDKDLETAPLTEEELRSIEETMRLFPQGTHVWVPIDCTEKTISSGGYSVPAETLLRLCEMARASLSQGVPEAVVEALDAAREQVERWYREPPVAEGGDFMAGMYKLRAALAALGETDG